MTDPVHTYQISHRNSVKENTKFAVLKLNGVWKQEAKAGRKVDSIKSLRAMTSPVMGLKEAKDIVEAYIASVGYYDSLSETMTTIKTLKGEITINKNMDGSYTVVETVTDTFYSESEAMIYLYKRGSRNQASA